MKKFKCDCSNRHFDRKYGREPMNNAGKVIMFVVGIGIIIYAVIRIGG